ncbi:MAG: S8 family peptidase, partial [Candidatus Puniceispirillaceae bacterium]
MDKFYSEIKGIIGKDIHCPFSVIQKSVPAALVMALVAACGGGGGSGTVATAQRVVVTKPPLIDSPARTTLNFGADYEAEFSAQSGLAAIGAESAYEKGYAGFGVRLALADTGVDSAHPELTHIAQGYDFHGDSAGLSDPDGHGTHVASLIAAKRNAKDMHGVAPYAKLSSYRIFDDHGGFGGKTGSEIMPVLVNEVIAADISVLNNSWASNYEISDLSKSVIAGALGAELPAWQKA